MSIFNYKYKRCWNCGKKLEPNAVICPYCQAMQDQNQRNTTNSNQQSQKNQNAFNDANVHNENHVSNKTVYTNLLSTDILTFGQAYIAGWKNMFDFLGTTNRSDFWKWRACNWIINIIILIIAYVITKNSPTLMIVCWTIGILYALILLTMSLSARARRFRDAGANNIFIVIVLACSFITGISWLASLVSLCVECLSTNKIANWFSK